MQLSQRLKSVTLIAIAVGAMLIVIARAHLQSVTIDEADSFLGFASGPDPMQWYPSSGNHVLNSLIMRLFATIFGISHLTLRSSAMIGAALFITACYFAARMVTKRFSLRVALLICLIFNPFILDYLVAARGYSLALGFLMIVVCSFFCIARDQNVALKDVESLAIIASLSAGLSFTASFSFALADGAAIFFFYLALIRARRSNWLRLASASFAPAIAVVMLIAGSTLFSFSRDQLYYGAHKIREMWASIVAASLYQPNPEILNPALMRVFNSLEGLLPYAFSVALLVLLAAGARTILQSGFKPAAWMSIYLASVLGASFGLHFMLHGAFKILLPLDRTASFFVPLSMLLLATLGEMQSARTLRWIGAATLIAGAIYFAGCLRLSHFREWDYDADTEETYFAVRDVASHFEIHDVAPIWMYAGPMKFYALRDHRTDLNYFTFDDKTKPDRIIYVVHEAFYGDFVRQHQLKIVHRAPSGAVVCVPAHPRS